MQYCHINMLSLAILACTLTAAASGGGGEDSSAAALTEKCTDDFNKVVACLSYATGKAEVPTKECCGSVQDIKSKHPVCLCFFMEQALNGSAESKGMGIQEDRLIQLPSACKLTNASVSFCPKLLNIPANSPEYKIFTNVSSVSSTSPHTTGASLPNSKSNGPIFGPQISGPLTFVFAIFFYVFCA